PRSGWAPWEGHNMKKTVLALVVLAFAVTSCGANSEALPSFGIATLPHEEVAPVPWSFSRCD
ncbi:MAG: hypothetical protein ABI239_07995, partial [Aquihabitans sp.]